MHLGRPTLAQSMYLGRFILAQSRNQLSSKYGHNHKMSDLYYFLTETRYMSVRCVHRGHNTRRGYTYSCL